VPVRVKKTRQNKEQSLRSNLGTEAPVMAAGHDTAILKAFSGKTGGIGGHRAVPANRFATPYPCGRTLNAALSVGLMPPTGFAFEINRKILP
jgi:hypothetical protein